MAAKGKTANTGPAHPGVGIADTVLAKLGLTQDQLAKLTGVSRRTINQLVNFRRNLTADMALRIAKVTGTNAREWLEQQIAYDLHQTEQALSKVLAKIPHSASKVASAIVKPAGKAAPKPVKIETDAKKVVPKAAVKSAAPKAAAKPVAKAAAKPAPKAAKAAAAPKAAEKPAAKAAPKKADKKKPAKKK